MWKINGTTVKLIQGDITEYDGDAIVNAANTELFLGAGVAGAIKRKGGDSLQKECYQIGSVELGEAALTSGGTLKVDYVIHAASMYLGKSTEEDSLKKSIMNSLKRGSEKDLKSIAFPAIGTGIGGISKQVCAKIFTEVLFSYLKTEPHVFEEIAIILFDKIDYGIFLDVFKRELKS